MGDRADSNTDPFALEASAALIELAMSESHRPVDELSKALERISRQLSAATTMCREQLARDIAVCIESLQFHDRMLQQLSRARMLVAGDASPNEPATWLTRTAQCGSVELF